MAGHSKFVQRLPLFVVPDVVSGRHRLAGMGSENTTDECSVPLVHESVKELPRNIQLVVVAVALAVFLLARSRCFGCYCW